jgi:hypothetical protein
MLDRPQSKFDRHNETLATKGLHLHPTKGMQKLPYTRMLASMITDQMKAGNRNWTMRNIQTVLRAAAHA